MVYSAQEVRNTKTRIQQIIDKECITKTKFAERLHISQPTVSQYCAGIKVPSDRTIADICREFRIDEHWLRTGEGEMYKTSTQAEEISRFMADVLTTAPDARSAFIAALAELPPEFYPMIAQLAKDLVDKLQKEE